jgi:hypothetical protein
VESKRVLGSLSDDPAVKMTAAVSPIALPMANITPVTIPGFADGRTTLVTVCHLVEPSAKLASRYASGTALIASSDVLTIVGSIIAERVRAPDRTDQPKSRYITKNKNPGLSVGAGKDSYKQHRPGNGLCRRRTQRSAFRHRHCALCHHSASEYPGALSRPS